MQNSRRKSRRGHKRAPVACILFVAALVGGVALCYSALRAPDNGPAVMNGQAITPAQSTVRSAVAGSTYTVSDTPSANASKPDAHSFASTSSAASAPANAAGSGLTTAVNASEDWRLVLVNAKNKLESDYDVELGTVGNYQLDARILDDLNAMLAAAKKDGHTLVIYSAYRPMERSRVLYTNKVQQYINSGYTRAAAEAEAARWIAPPGTSEHNTGLSVDLISGDYFTKFNDLVHEFDTTAEFKWLYANCAEYGFILRYPEDKQEMTGITYEPWHYRYVGREAARDIMEQKICLEEYVTPVA